MERGPTKNLVMQSGKRRAGEMEKECVAARDAAARAAADDSEVPSWVDRSARLLDL